MKAVEKKTGYFTSFDGTKIYCETRGEGKPLVLIYGIVCQMNHWVHQIRHFSSNGYQVITMDYRGHHKSETPASSDQLTLEALARDIRGLFQHLGLEKAFLFGHSMGVQTLVKFAELFPEHVAGQVYVNGFASNPFKGLLGLRNTGDVVDLVRQLYHKFPDKLQNAWRWLLLNPLSIPITALAGGFNLNLTAKKDIEIYMKGVSLIDFEVFLTLFEDMLNYEGDDVLPRISAPTMVMTGLKDSVTPAKIQQRMAKLLPDSTWVKVPYGSHCTQLDYPEFVNLKIEKYLAQKGW
jgi:pimeloyl-ACP methyl ester carboxylesterase